MRKFPFFAVLLALILALTSTTILAQRGEGRGRGGHDNIGDDNERTFRDEAEASDLREGKHQDRSKHNVSPDLNQNGLGRPGFALTTGGTAATSPITYHGGPVIGTPVIYLIFYGNWNQANGTDTPAGKQLLIDWAQDIGGTSRYAVNASFPGVSGGAIYGGATDYVGTTRTRLTDTQILSAVDSTITSGRLPFNSNGVYFLVTSSNVTASSGFCTQYCGWHTHSVRSYGDLRYSFVGNAARCLTGCASQSISPNNNPGVDGSISIITHELEEANTDPNLNAWFDAAGAENSDKCAWTFGHFQFQVANGSWANVAGARHNYMIQRGLLHGSSDFCMQNTTQN